MPSPFKQITRNQFASLLDKFPFSRKINSVHMHHTWRPNRAQYKGHDTIVAMWRYHTEHNGWADIAQHITIAPDGTIWLGRNWDLPPASSSGHNGNKVAGPFMFEIIGDFDKNADPFDGEQRRTVIDVIARVQKKFGLAPESLMFHNMMSGKTCPGNGISYSEVVAEITKLQPTLNEAPREVHGADSPFSPDALESSQVVEEALALLARPAAEGKEPADAEPCHDRLEEEFTIEENLDAARESGLSPFQLQALRPYLVNLNMGQFSSEGEWKTSREDVDAIFEDHLPEALEDARRNKAPLRLVFYAHGGLNSESVGLQIAQKNVAWWKANNLYPIYFAWETGAFETIGQLLRRAHEGAARALPRDIFDFTTDPLIQETIRALQGPRIWGGMKLSAQLASLGDGTHDTANAEGGARYVARKLADFCTAHAGQVELHAVGHSAGSIFHSHFIPTALDFGAPPFRSVHFMAPAVRVDLFKQQLADRVGPDKGIDQLTIFTMRKDLEQDDNCGAVYRKSLLYLIHYALEPERKTPILGLEISLRGDASLKKLFGLGFATANGEVVWSKSPVPQGRSASTSGSHGGFDDDGPTMNSIARRILGKADADRIVEYVSGQIAVRDIDPWRNQVDWPEQLGFGIVATPLRPAGMHQIPFQPTSDIAIPQPSRIAVPEGPGRRRALCVGINRYPSAPLQGCIADANAWAKMLIQLGFEEPAMLFDERATRASIIRGMEALISSSRAGDVIVFQYSGHGTQLPDVNGDEAGGDSSGQDEAICPYDFASGAFLIDDDVGEIFGRLPAGVNLTCFIDCCHSGTISRFGVGTTPGITRGRQDERPRFIQPSPELVNAHRRYREDLGNSRAVTSGGPSLMREIVFSACLSSEVAWESGGQGEFTVRALRVFQRGVNGLSHQQFEQQVTAEFGPAPRQHARLYCSAQANDALLLQPLGTSIASPAVPGKTHADVTVLLKSLQNVIQQFQQSM